MFKVKNLCSPSHAFKSRSPPPRPINFNLPACINSFVCQSSNHKWLTYHLISCVYVKRPPPRLDSLCSHLKEWRHRHKALAYHAQSYQSTNPTVARVLLLLSVLIYFMQTLIATFLLLLQIIYCKPTSSLARQRIHSHADKKKNKKLSPRARIQSHLSGTHGKRSGTMSLNSSHN